MTEHTNPHSSDQGSALVIALIFILAMGLVMGAITTFATNAMSNTINLNQQRATTADIESTATIAIDYVRNNYVDFGTTPSNCMPGQSSYATHTEPPASLTAFCTDDFNPGTPASRIVQFYVCPAGATCSHVDLYASVTYDDVPPNAPASADTCTSPLAGHPNTCGLGMTINAWDVRGADN